MKRVVYILCSIMLMFASACKYDDSILTGRVDDLEQRVTSLEEQCRQINTNITSLQTIVTALQANDYVISVEPLYSGKVVIGYTISFTKSPSITIYHGQDGQDGQNGADGKDGVNGADGYTPAIGVKQDADGHYYWTLDGEWLTDQNGQKISAEGTPGQDGADGKDGQNGTDGKDGQDGADGKDGQNGNDGKDGVNGADGITPEFKIEDGSWYISLDKGLTWEYLGRAQGADGKDGQNGSDGQDGDSMFRSIDTSNPGYITFVLADGTEISVPRMAELAINFDVDGMVAIRPNSTRAIKYTVSGNTDDLHIEVLSSGNLRAKISDTSSATGTLTVTTGATIDEYDKVVVLVANISRTIMKSLTFEEGALNIIGANTFDVPAEGGAVSLTVETNTQYSVSIPSDVTWISMPTSRAMRTETIKLQIEPNESAARNAEIALIDADGIRYSVFIAQKGVGGIPADMTEAFPDPIFREYVLTNFDLNHDGKITEDEAIQVTEINVAAASNVSDSKKIASLEGVQYFTELRKLDVSNNNLATINVLALTKLETLNCRDNRLTTLDVSNLTRLEELQCQMNELTDLNISNTYSLKSLYCHNNLFTHLSFDSSDHSKLTNLTCNYNKLVDIDLTNVPNLYWLDCSTNELTEIDVSNQFRLVYIFCDANKLVSLDVSHCTELIQLTCFDNYLTDLELGNNWALQSLDCGYNKLASLNVEGNGRLMHLNCENNHLYVLEISKAYDSWLQEIKCDNNNLSELIFGQGSSVSSLSCANNKLTSLSVVYNAELTNLDCSYNQLTELEVQNYPNLKTLNCSENKLTSLDIAQTQIGNNTEEPYPLKCTGLHGTLVLKEGWSIQGINVDRSPECISDYTDIDYLN